MKKTEIVNLICAVVIGAGLVIMALFALPDLSAKMDMNKTSGKTQYGIKIVKLMEAASAKEVEDKIYEIERKEILRRVVADDTLVFETLKSLNTLIVGDSRAVGFIAGGFLDESHVLASVSSSIMSLPGLFDTITNLNPRFVVVTYGINEIGRSLSTPVYYYEDSIYTDDILRCLGEIQNRLPSARLYYCSILPVSDAALAGMDGFSIIPRRNEAIKECCLANGFGYIDASDIAYAHQEMYREDGIHFNADFYPLWGREILVEILNDEVNGQVAEEVINLNENR